MRLILAVTVTTALVAGCGIEGATSSTTFPEPVTTTTTTTEPPGNRVSTSTVPSVTGEVPEDLLRPVLQDASERAGVPAGELEVTRSQATEWPDGALGCPEPGQSYIQVIIPGYWVEIEGPDDAYDYRLDAKGNFKLCETGRLPLGRP
ncbi:MAG TPA: hypothetical protein VF246_09020 [Acidimicrobiia bacterium]